MHFHRFYVYTTDGIELINEKIPGAQDPKRGGIALGVGTGNLYKYKIPDSAFTTGDAKGKPREWTNGLNAKIRHAFKVREPYSTDSAPGHNQHYYHSLGGGEWWQVDLGAEYHIARIVYDYRQMYQRQVAAANAGGKSYDRLQLMNKNGTSGMHFNKSLKDHKAFFGQGTHTVWDF